MINNKLSLYLFACSFLSSTYCQAGIKEPVNHPFYVGIIGGYGSTTWDGLVPDEKNQNIALALSTPIDVEEGGAAWGAIAGYEFSPNFALEANYMRYPNATIYFDPVNSLFSAFHDGQSNFITHTDTIGLMAKIMLPIHQSKFRVYSGAGAAAIYRKDIIVDEWRSAPVFGVGVNYNFTEHIMGELAGNYTTGFGESVLSPADTYFSFLYSITARLAYRF